MENDSAREDALFVIVFLIVVIVVFFWFIRPAMCNNPLPHTGNTWLCGFN
jgi:hypothetical protein